MNIYCVSELYSIKVWSGVLIIQVSYYTDLTLKHLIHDSFQLKQFLLDWWTVQPRNDSASLGCFMFLHSEEEKLGNDILEWFEKNEMVEICFAMS